MIITIYQYVLCSSPLISNQNLTLNPGSKNLGFLTNARTNFVKNGENVGKLFPTWSPQFFSKVRASPHDLKRSFILNFKFVGGAHEYRLLPQKSQQNKANTMRILWGPNCPLSASVVWHLKTPQDWISTPNRGENVICNIFLYLLIIRN